MIAEMVHAICKCNSRWAEWNSVDSQSESERLQMLANDLTCYPFCESYRGEHLTRKYRYAGRRRQNSNYNIARVLAPYKSY